MWGEKNKGIGGKHPNEPMASATASTWPELEIAASGTFPLCKKNRKEAEKEQNK